MEPPPNGGGGSSRGSPVAPRGSVAEVVPTATGATAAYPSGLAGVCRGRAHEANDAVGSPSVQVKSRRQNLAAMRSAEQLARATFFEDEPPDGNRPQVQLPGEASSSPKKERPQGGTGAPVRQGAPPAGQSTTRTVGGVAAGAPMQGAPSRGLRSGAPSPRGPRREVSTPDPRDAVAAATALGPPRPATAAVRRLAPRQGAQMSVSIASGAPDGTVPPPSTKACARALGTPAARPASRGSPGRPATARRGW